MKCRYCPRRLKTKESRDRGYGLVCGRKLGLIPPPTPRRSRQTRPVTAVTTPDQTVIPFQPTRPEE